METPHDSSQGVLPCEHLCTVPGRSRRDAPIRQRDRMTEWTGTRHLAWIRRPWGGGGVRSVTYHRRPAGPNGSLRVPRGLINAEELMPFCSLTQQSKRPERGGTASGLASCQSGRRDSNPRPPEPHGRDRGPRDVELREESRGFGGSDIESREQVCGVSHRLHTPGAYSSERVAYRFLTHS